MSYIPHTEQDRREMLAAIGVGDSKDLFTDIPSPYRFPPLNLPAALSELEVSKLAQKLAEMNDDLDHHPSFLGAGVYNHFIPAVVPHLMGRGEFYTAYTPYQPEVSQGTLTAGFEYQTMLCDLTGMDVANVSMYDGASALAEAAIMAVRASRGRRTKILVSSAVHPEYRQTLQTYMQGMALPVQEIGFDPEGPTGGRTDLTVLEKEIDDQTAAVAVQYPNFFGVIEDLAGIARVAHDAGALLIVSANPIALGLLKPPGELGADIVTGEGQPLGIPPGFGGPFLGLFAARKKLMRSMPGRIIGETKDTKGRRGFVLTMTAREQHIRREKATSNICSNEALMALAATIYMATMGKQGVREVAELCFHKAHYAAEQIDALDGYSLMFRAPFFHEFAVRGPKPAAELANDLSEAGIIGGYDLGRDYPDLRDTMLFCVTEQNTRADIDLLVEVCRA
ncbi:MAG: aminomethyl-transferring glycine dehydrogenase subunit GcvPA [Chloroflexi bacterium]|nr:aminomethyl-transferring glycine dehydrogenase subunit GcvPA [Chloroflexota bacterium]